MNTASKKNTLFIKPASSRRGAVLIIVLWISTGLVTLVLLFGYSMMLEYRSAENTLAAYQAEQAIEGGMRYIKYILSSELDPGELPDEEEYTFIGLPIGHAYFWLIGRDNDTTFTSSEPYFGLVDESSKININTAPREILLAIPGMTESLAGAIIDWRDEDDDVTENGAETSSYFTLRPGYECKNAMFETPFELRLLYNITYEDVFGEDANLNGVLDMNENDGQVLLPFDDQDGTLEPGIWEYITIYTKHPNTDSDGEEKININDDEDNALQDLLSENVNEDRISELNLGGGGPGGQGQTEYESVLDFYVKSGLEQEEFEPIEDRITTSDEEFITGLVNVNTASADVLACIPGIDTEMAQSLVSYRQSHADSVGSIAWVAEILEEEAIEEAGAYLTTKSYQCTADIAAVGRNGKGYRRVRFVIDRSEEEPRIVYRGDCSKLGWALGPTVKQQLEVVKESEI